MNQHARTRAHLVRDISNLCLVAGVVVLIGPLVWAASTGRSVTERQTAALAEWESHAGPAAIYRSAASATTGMRLTIPRLALQRFIPEGATPQHLQEYGLGRISWTARPDTDGIVGIAGHRTTYGAPFLHLDRLRAGDIITIDYNGHRYVYSVIRQDVIRPERVDVFEKPIADRGIVLIACTPISSAAFRLVVLGRLLGVSQVASP